MDVTCVMDSQTAIKAGKAVVNELEYACITIPDVKFRYIEDIMSEENQENFFNADVVIVDMTSQDQWYTLSYKLGMRENYGMTQNIVIVNNEDSSNQFPMESATFFPLVKYKFNSDFQCVVDPPDLLRTCESSGNVSETQVTLLRQRIWELLQNFQVQTKAHKKDKFLNDLHKAFETSTGDSLRKALHRLRLKLDDADIISPETVYKVLYSLREIQEYDEMVKLVDDLRTNPALNFNLTPAIIHLYGFALIRRNRDGDTELAEKLVTSALQKEENQIQEMFCLCGRIHKDKFIQSGDKTCLQEAIHWYRKGFNFLQDKLAHPGINLATLLVIDGNNFCECPELQKIAMLLNVHLGRKGGLDKIDNYWDVATYFELSLLTKDYTKAVVAASCMYKLKPPKWFLQTTMNNVKLIQHSQWKSDQLKTGSEETVFKFWIDFLIDGVSDNDCSNDQLPILTVDADGGFLPCYMNLKDGSEVESSVTTPFCIICPNDISKEHQKIVVMAETIRNFSLCKQDNRCLFLYLHQNSEDIQLCFSSETRCQQFFNLLKDTNTSTS